MRKVIIKLDDVKTRYECGVMFETNVTELEISLGNVVMADADFYLLEFETEKGTFNSERLQLKSDKIIFIIPEAVTQFENVKAVLAAYKNESDVAIMKSQIINLHFLKAIKSDGSPTPKINGYIKETVELIKTGKLKGEKGDKGDKGDRAAIPDYNQNNETAEDYIKNRPFYKIQNVYEFTEEKNYKTSFAILPEGTVLDNEKVYVFRILDKPIPYEELHQSLLSVHVYDRNDVSDPIERFDALARAFVWELCDNNETPEQTEEDKENNIVYLSFYLGTNDDDEVESCNCYNDEFNNFIIFYKDTDIETEDVSGNPVILTPGTYCYLSEAAVNHLVGETEYAKVYVDKVESKPIIKKLDKEFLPEIISKNDITDIVDERINTAVLSVLGGES